MSKGKAWQVLAVALLLGVAVSSSLAGTIRADRSDQLYLSLASLPQYASVGQVKFTAPGGNYLGSGTLVAPTWVLTAAHVVDKTTSLNFNIGGQSYSGSSWFAYPGWTGNLTAGYDIGLVKLSAPVAGIAPAARYTGTNELGKVATFVGYGMTGTGLTGAIKYDGKKRAGQNMIDRFYSGTSSTGRILMADFDNPKKASDNRYGSATPLNLEYLIAPGDSGGGVFEDFNGLSMLVGVNSFGMAWDGKVNSDYGDASGHTRVSAFNAWIDGILAGNVQAALSGSGNLTGQIPLDMAAVPEPASMSLLILGALAILRRRRTR